MGRIFREFRELACIREINFQRKLIHRYVIRTSRMLPVHGSLSVRMASEDIPSAKREMSGLVHQDKAEQ